VPTWNYVVVHAYGPLQVVADEHWLLTHIEQLTPQSETDAPTPWRVSDAPSEFVRTLLNGILGFELPIHRLEGKWKVSQNRSARDKQGVVDGLTARNTPEALTMKNLVAERS
jgi:transcriptional regulator